VICHTWLVGSFLGIALTWGTGLASWGYAKFIATCNQLGFISSLWLGECGAVVQSWSNISASFYQWDLSCWQSQNLESASAVGDTYPVAPCLRVNGIGTLVAAICGSCSRLLFILVILAGKLWGKSRLLYTQWYDYGLALLSGTVAMLACPG